MATKLNPYVNIRGGLAREALEFYRSVFGGEVMVMTFGEFGGEGRIADLVMHGQLITETGRKLMVADAPEEIVQITVGDNVSIAIDGEAEDAERLRGIFAALASDGGRIENPLLIAPWGDEFGSVVDRYEIHWMLNIAGTEPEEPFPAVED
ncbi:VOC family protein [Nocardioides yefusunii]|uniref:VOC family protein n=1 Tax=Nocardioides yefusunii TaxID=2500546 RepID=A0ABW1QYK7_9ACTN|nr:VOC family protein [Nocardioides yefusunii]